ncbi:MAG TPA: hypothetical protein PLV83_04310 [Bacilli bacterium]|nr:hypothetical protein [Bacilli bacterium]
MVNYKLSVKDNNSFKEIIWNKESYASLNNHSLEDIDKFTSNFVSTIDLKKKLLEINAMEYEDVNKKINIRYLSRGLIKTLSYEMCLKDDLLFMDIKNINEYLINNKNDKALLEKLCNHYKNSYANGNNIMLIRNYLNGDYSINIDRILENFVIREVTVYDSSKNSYKLNNDGTFKYNYRKIHDLAMFLAYDYKKRIDPKLYQRQNPDERFSIPKVLVRKKDQIPGQLSLFD